MSERQDIAIAAGDDGKATVWERLQALARHLAERRRLLLELLVAATLLSAVCAALGYVILGEGNQHQLFREIGPIALFAVLEVAAVALLGYLIATHESHIESWRDWNNFWLLCSAGFAFLTIDQAVDLHGWIGSLILHNTSIEHPLGFHRPSDFILFLYMAAGLVIALIHYRALLEYLDVFFLLVVGAMLVAVSIGIDAFWSGPSTAWVIEETVTLYAGAFFVAAFALRYRYALAHEPAGDEVREPRSAAAPAGPPNEALPSPTAES